MVPMNKPFIKVTTKAPKFFIEKLTFNKKIYTNKIIKPIQKIVVK